MGLIYQVPQSHCVIIERLGKFSRVVQPGLHLRLPFIERQKDVIRDCGWKCGPNPIACKRQGNYTIIELSDQRLNTNPRNYHTRDNVPVSIDAVIFWRITNPKAAVYTVDRLIESLIDLALNALRSKVGAMTLDKLLSERAKLNEATVEEIVLVAQKWGIAIQRVEIQELKTDDATTDAMRSEMAAERERRAAILIAEGAAKSMVLKAEAEKTAMILQAEAEKNSTILRAEGEAKAKELIAQADAIYIEKICSTSKASPKEVLQILLAQKYIDGFDAISQNPSDKVFLPNSPVGLNLFLDSNTERGGSR